MCVCVCVNLSIERDSELKRESGHVTQSRVSLVTSHSVRSVEPQC